MDWREAEAAFEHPVLTETTLPRAFEESAARNAARIAQLYKGGVYDRSLVDGGVVPAALAGEFEALTYAEVRRIVRRLAAGFRDLGVEPDDRVGIFSHTRMEWAQCDFALLAAGAVVTTVYPSSSTDQVRYLLGDAEASGVVVENAALLERVLAVADDLNLSFVVVVDEFDAEAIDAAGVDVNVRGEQPDRETDSLAIYSLADVHERGAAAYDADAYESWLDARDRDDLASLLYTSGTTGRPKGVKLTHGNFRANVDQCFRRLGPRPDRGGRAVVGEQDRLLSFLPLSHVFERLVGHFLPFSAGASVAYAESPDALREDVRGARPTMLTSVPRVYEKLYDAAREGAGDGFRRRVFDWALAVGRRHYDADDPGVLLRGKRALADRLAFRQVRDALGGRIEHLISGGGSLSADLCANYHAMGMPILEGYGLTETSPVVSVNPPERPRVGTVGPPLHGVETRLDTDVGESIEAVDGGEVGELLVRGPAVTEGYWKDPEATDAAFTDGWFCTGDIVERRPDDYVRFRERAKEVLALSTGKKVAPVPVEEALTDSAFVDQAMVVGDDRKFVAALLVPNFPRVRAWAEEEEAFDLPETPVEICADRRVEERIEAAVEQVNQRLEPHKRIRQFSLESEAFTEANGLLTPTMKKKRGKILDRYADEVAALYDG